MIISLQSYPQRASEAYSQIGGTLHRWFETQINWLNKRKQVKSENL